MVQTGTEPLPRKHDAELILPDYDPVPPVHNDQNEDLDGIHNHGPGDAAIRGQDNVVHYLREDLNVPVTDKLEGPFYDRAVTENTYQSSGKWFACNL